VLNNCSTSALRVLIHVQHVSGCMCVFPTTHSPTQEEKKEKEERQEFQPKTTKIHCTRFPKAKTPGENVKKKKHKMTSFQNSEHKSRPERKKRIDELHTNHMEHSSNQQQHVVSSLCCLEQVKHDLHEKEADGERRIGNYDPVAVLMTPPAVHVGDKCYCRLVSLPPSTTVNITDNSNDSNAWRHSYTSTNICPLEQTSLLTNPYRQQTHNPHHVYPQYPQQGKTLSFLCDSGSNSFLAPAGLYQQQLQPHHRPLESPILYDEQAAEETIRSIQHLIPPEPEHSDDDKDDDLCLICMDQPKNASLIHGDSAHIICCIDCAKMIMKNKASCPVCRKDIQLVVKNYN
jgi:hypothetical protein